MMKLSNYYRAPNIPNCLRPNQPPSPTTIPHPRSFHTNRPTVTQTVTPTLIILRPSYKTILTAHLQIMTPTMPMNIHTITLQATPPPYTLQPQTSPHTIPIPSFSPPLTHPLASPMLISSTAIQSPYPSPPTAHGSSPRMSTTSVQARPMTNCGCTSGTNIVSA
jgi:hypothetical protein